MRAPLPAIVVLALAAAASCSSAARHPARPRGDSGRYEGSFAEVLRAAEPGRRFTALVDLTEQVDLRALTARLRAEKRGKPAMREAVLAALEATASRQQARLIPLLDRLRAEGSITSVHPVAVVNRVIVEGTAAAIASLASSPEVAVIRPDWTSERAAASRSIELPDDPTVPLGTTFRSWAIDAMNVEALWRQGYDGTGIVVAAIDTGAFEGHEQLSGRRAPGERGWFDPVESSTAPYDRHGHGTNVLSQAVGKNPEGRVVGVAPKAYWAAALGNWKNFYDRSRMTLAADWVLRTAKPDVLINAWSHDEGDCNAFDRPFIEAWKAAGIFVVFPAGNGGPKASTGESPAQLPSVFSVTALAGLLKPSALASRGPSRCGSASFPTVAAPGSDLPMAAIGSAHAYLRGQGTSLAAGLVGGAAALLLQAEPETDPETLERILADSARDVPPPGRDDVTGAGAIDLAAALEMLRARKASYR